MSKFPDEADYSRRMEEIEVLNEALQEAEDFCKALIEENNRLRRENRMLEHILAKNKIVPVELD